MRTKTVAAEKKVTSIPKEKYSLELSCVGSKCVFLTCTTGIEVSHSLSCLQKGSLSDLTHPIKSFSGANRHLTARLVLHSPVSLSGSLMLTKDGSSRNVTFT